MRAVEVCGPSPPLTDTSCSSGPPTRRVGLLCSEASSTRPLWLPLPCGLWEESAPPCPEISSSCRKCGRELLSQCVHATMTAVRKSLLARVRCCCHSTCSPPRLRSHLYFELSALPARAARPSLAWCALCSACQCSLLAARVHTHLRVAVSNERCAAQDRCGCRCRHSEHVRLHSAAGHFARGSRPASRAMCRLRAGLPGRAR